MTIMAPAAPHRSLGADAYRLYTEAYAVYLRTLSNLNVSKEKVSLAKTTCSLDKARLSAKYRSDKSRAAPKPAKAPKPATAPAVTMPPKANSPQENQQSTGDLKRELIRAQIASLKQPVTQHAVPTPAASSSKTKTTTVNNAGPSVNVMGDQNNLYNFSASGVEPARGPSLALMQALPQLRSGTAVGQEMAAASRFWLLWCLLRCCGQAAEKLW